mmetsp:Transcript_9812/g.32200  ORF Transcript_9812/g.32200 Transcript_9812/m.32200 type:complete len:458 (-) Transcript_9812:399-1772(-)
MPRRVFHHGMGAATLPKAAAKAFTKLSARGAWRERTVRRAAPRCGFTSSRSRQKMAVLAFATLSGGAAGGSGEEEEGPLFSTEAGSESCTKKTSYANLSWFGDRGKPFTAIDTPGHDDPDGADIDSPEAREALGEIAADLHNKLRAIKKVNAILVLHNDVHSNRLNPATYTILKMVAEKFAAAGDGGDVWKHVILAYAKCNSHDVSWQASIAKKKRDLQAAVRAKIPSCKVEVPVVTLGGATVSGEGAGAMAAAGKAKEKEGFDELWTFLQTAGDLDCTKLQPFEGADVKWEKMIKAKDEAEARARASLIYIAVLAKLGGFLVFLFWRAFMLPRYVAFLLASAIGAYAVHQIVTCSGDVPRTPLFGAALALLMVNMHTVADELLILGLFVKFVGYETMAYSVRHSYRVWLEPHAGPFVDAAMEKAGPLLQAAQEQVKKLTVSVAPPAKPSAETKKNL